MNDFISQSGWFSFPGMPHSKEALHRVLAKKCKMSYIDFMVCKEAVYKLDYTNGEKVNTRRRSNNSRICFFRGGGVYCVQLSYQITH